MRRHDILISLPLSGVQEDIANLEKRNQKRDTREIALVILIRTLTNLSVLLILIGAGVAIFMAAQLGLDSVSLLQ